MEKCQEQYTQYTEFLEEFFESYETCRKFNIDICLNNDPDPRQFFSMSPRNVAHGPQRR